MIKKLISVLKFIKTGEYFVVCGKDQDEHKVYGAYLSREKAFKVAQSLRNQWGDEHAHVKILYKGYE